MFIKIIRSERLIIVQDTLLGIKGNEYTIISLANDISTHLILINFHNFIFKTKIVATINCAKIEANKGKRLNLIGAMSMAEFKLIAPVTFEGGCKRDTVENWLHTLGQSLPKDELDSYPQRFLIMDNARFHRGGDLKQIAEKYNLTLLYLPPYSPELNPVEHKWAVVKQKVKLSINDFDSLHDCVKYCSV